jgi:hypothetical protein
MTTLRLAAIALCAIFLGVAPAQAQQLWDFTYSGDGYTGTGTFTTTEIVGGEATILGITGTLNGDAITGLLPVNFLGDNDNLIFVVDPQLDGDGFSFSTATLGDFNVSGDSPCGGSGYVQDTDGTCGTAIAVEFSATEVPEPASAAFVLLGLATIGVMRQRSFRG